MSIVTFARRVRDDERGSGFVAGFVVLFSVLALAGVGTLVDTARLVAADRQCATVALEAARAGANALDVSAVRGGGGIALDPATAHATAAAAASAFVDGTGVTLTSVSFDGTRVSVTVRASVDPWFPVLSARTVSSSAAADAIVVVPG